jgi:hypothetical protein
MPEQSDADVKETLSRYEVEIERLREAFALLGVGPCSCCGTFFRRSDPGALFDAGGLVCYGCIPTWWPQRCSQLSIKERENIEGKLVFWLREYHHAETFKDPAKLPDPAQQELHLIATCLECRGTGKSLGDDHCRFCAGRGTVWIVVPRKQA